MMYSVQCMCLGWRAAHLKSVRGVAVDNMNMEVFSGSADSTVKVRTPSLILLLVVL